MRKKRRKSKKRANSPSATAGGTFASWMRSAASAWSQPSDTLMFDPVQAPSLRHAFELMNAAILEADSRLRHQILDRARDQDLAGARLRGNARADVKRETEYLGPAHFVFARVQAYPDLQPQRA